MRICLLVLYRRMSRETLLQGGRYGLLRLQIELCNAAPSTSASVVRPDSQLTKPYVTGYARKAGCLMAPPLSSSSLIVASRHSARSTFVNHFGLHPGDHSYLLVRERSVKTAAGEHFALHGAFDPAAIERLAQSLRGLSSAAPLALDLRGITALDEASVTRLLKLRRELSESRSVTFQIADDSPVAALIGRLGLEEKFGLVPVRLPLKRTAAPTFSPAEKSASREFAVS